MDAKERRVRLSVMFLGSYGLAVGIFLMGRLPAAIERYGNLLLEVLPFEIDQLIESEMLNSVYDTIQYLIIPLLIFLTHCLSPLLVLFSVFLLRHALRRELSEIKVSWILSVMVWLTFLSVMSVMFLQFSIWLDLPLDIKGEWIGRLAFNDYLMALSHGAVHIILITSLYVTKGRLKHHRQQQDNQRTEITVS